MEEKNNFVRVRKHKKKDHANYLSPLAPTAVFRLCFFRLKEEVCETLDLMCSSCHLEYMYIYFYCRVSLSAYIWFPTPKMCLFYPTTGHIWGLIRMMSQIKKVSYIITYYICYASYIKCAMRESDSVYFSYCMKIHLKGKKIEQNENI